MHDNEAIVVVLPSMFVFIAVLVAMGSRHYQRIERLKVMQKAIESGTLDDATRRTILEALSADQRQGSEWMRALGQHLTFLARNLLFIGGWITMFVGGAFWLLSSIRDEDSRYQQDGLIATFVGFALVTVPLALRELESRRQSKAA
jgi:hypothetical protein